jgi:hypothetical protein
VIPKNSMALGNGRIFAGRSDRSDPVRPVAA